MVNAENWGTKIMKWWCQLAIA